MENLFVLTGISKACTWALTSEKMSVKLEIMPKDYEGIAIFLHAVLAQVCAGKALTLVRLQQDHNGLLAWRRLVTEYEPKQALRWTTMLTALMNPKWTDSSSFDTQWLDWERSVALYEQQSGANLPEDIKAAIVLEHAPKSVRDFLESSAVDCTDSYATLRSQVRLFTLRRRRFDDTGQLRAGSSGSMSVDELVAWIKGKGKGKGKGKAAGKGKQPAAPAWQPSPQWQQPQPYQQQWQQPYQQPTGKGKGKGKPGKGKQPSTGTASAVESDWRQRQRQRPWERQRNRQRRENSRSMLELWQDRPQS